MPVTGASRNPWFWTVLTLLHERPMHPYELAQLTRERGKDLFAAHKPGSLYSVVERLHTDGLIAAVEVAREGRRPERTVYRITGQGRAALLEWLRDELGGLDERDLPRFAFAVEKLVHLHPATAAELLHARADAVATQLAQLDRITEDAAARDVGPVSLLEIDYARALRSAELAWLRRACDDIDTTRLSWTPPDTDLDADAHPDGQKDQQP